MNIKAIYFWNLNSSPLLIRCVLAASSPVFAALLPSSGALLELHDPRLPAAVLAHVLDYIYTGVVPSLCGQQQLYSLLDAAEYLQMDGLREALRAGQAEDRFSHTRAGHRFYSDSEFGETPVKHLHESGETEDYEEPHCGIHTTNKISCIKQMEGTTASVGDVRSNAMSDSHPRPGHTASTMSSNVTREEEQEQSWRRHEERYQITSTKQQRRNLRTRVKPLCLSPPTKQREELQRNIVGGSPVRWIADVSTSSPPPPPPVTTPVTCHPPLPHRSLSVSSSGSCGAVRVIHHSSELLPLASLLVGYTRLGRTPCGQPGSTAAEDKMLRSNDTDDVSGPAADSRQDGRQSQDRRSLTERTEQVYDSKLQSGGDKATQSPDEATSVRVTVASLPVTSLSPRSENYHGNLFPRWEGDWGGEGSHGNQGDDINSLQSTFDFVKGSLSTCDQPEEGSRPFSNQPDDEKEHPGSRPLPEFDIRPKLSKSLTPPVDRTSDDTYNIAEEPSYLGHLRYHYLPSEPSHLVDTHSHSDQADNTRPSSSPDKSPKEGEQFHGREPSAKLLFLDISSRSVQLQVFDQNGVGENGSGYGGGGGKGREGWAGAGPQALVEELFLGVSVAPGVGLSPHVGESYASTKQCDVDVCSDETRAREGQEPVGAVCDRGSGPTTLSKMEDRGYDPATPLPTPLTSPTLCKPLPSWLPAGRSSPEAQQLYQCSLCERPFSQRGSLNRHVRSHLGVRPYLCPRCPMTFSRQYRVTEHMRVHERYVLREDHLKVSRPPET